MKRETYTMIAMLILISTLGLTAQAQSSTRQHLIATIPFDFTVGERTLSAGEYTVRVINPASDRSVLEFRSEDGESIAMVQTMGVNGTANDTAKLTFRRYGDQYLFAQAWIAADGSGLAALRSKAERRLQRDSGRVGPKSDVVAVNAHYSINRRIQ